MKELQIVRNADINGVSCDFYENGKGEFFMTRQQIGQALGYENPEDGIYRIHKRHKVRLDTFSVIDRLTSTDGKVYETYLYSAKGVYEICRWSRQPKADEFYDKVYDILEGLRLGYFTLERQHQAPQWQQARQLSKDNRKHEIAEITKFVRYANTQGSENAKKYYISFSKLANKTVGLKSRQRDYASILQLTSLILAENIINHVIQEGIQQQKPYKEIYKACKSRLKEFQEITYFADLVQRIQTHVGR